MKVAVGVAGGIAAYKAAEVVRELQQRSLEVQVIMTAHAQEFVRPLTFAALSGNKVITGMFGPEGKAGPEPNLESAIEHIAVAQSIDLLLVAPATADILAKFSRGLADDFLSTTYLATKAPVVVVPAMNVNMWQHPATQENIARLRERGVHIVEPESGYLACGMTGPGRLASNEAIISRVMDVLAASADHSPSPQDLAGEVVLVTAGPTREAIDPVRYISNRSSGKMGYAIAAAARNRGARVVLVSGPTSLQAPEGIDIVRVSSVAEMRAAVLARFEESSIVIKAAAPADFRLRQQAAQKIHKSGDGLTLTLEPTEDILREIGQRKGDRVLVGFAAETEDLIVSAERKLKTKNLDLIVGNDVSGAETGFDSDLNSVVMLGQGGFKREFTRRPKTEVADEILNEVVRLRARAHARA